MNRAQRRAQQKSSIRYFRRILGNIVREYAKCGNMRETCKKLNIEEELVDKCRSDPFFNKKLERLEKSWS